jgi:hypothetical protein
MRAAGALGAVEGSFDSLIFISTDRQRFPAKSVSVVLEILHMVWGRMLQGI